MAAVPGHLHVHVYNYTHTDNEKQVKRKQKWKGEKVKKIKKVISILENALISDFVFSLLA